MKLADKQVEAIERKLWRLQAELINSGLFFKGDKIIDAINAAGGILYAYRQGSYLINEHSPECLEAHSGVGNNEGFTCTCKTKGGK